MLEYPPSVPFVVGWPSGHYWFAGIGTVHYDVGVPTLLVAAPNVLYATPFSVSSPAVFDRILCEVTAGAAGNVRMGLYSHNPVTGLPNVLVIDAGTADTAAAAVKEITIAQPLDAGTYWLVAVLNAAPTLRAGNLYNGGLEGRLIPLSYNVLGRTVNNISSSVDNIGGATVAFTYAALPASFPGGAAFVGTKALPRVALRSM